MAFRIFGGLLLAALSAAGASIHVSEARLSTHQRLEVVIRVQADAGKTEATLELTDAHGARTQTRVSLRKGIAEQRLFVLPGKYTLSAAFGGSETIAKRIHVPAPKADPLPQSWAELPAVEFVESTSDSPDSWFLPEMKGRLAIPVRTRRTLHVELLLDTHLNGRTSTSIIENRRNMATLVPAFEALAQLHIDNGSMEACVIDPALRRSVIERTAAGLNWIQLRAAIRPDSGMTVDVGSLERDRNPGAFLSGEIRRMLPAADDARAGIVLSGSAPSDDIPIDSRLFYIEYQTPRLKPERVQHRPSGNLKGPPIGVFRFAEAATVRGQHVYQVQSPEDFRAALADVIRALERM